MKFVCFVSTFGLSFFSLISLFVIFWKWLGVLGDVVLLRGAGWPGKRKSLRRFFFWFQLWRA